MNDVLLTNIFFTITGLAVVVVTAGIVAVLWYVVPMVRDLRDIVRRVHKAGEAVEKDFEALRANLRQEGTKGKLLVDMVLAFASRKLIARKRKPKQEINSNDN